MFQPPLQRQSDQDTMQWTIVTIIQIRKIWDENQYYFVFAREEMENHPDNLWTKQNSAVIPAKQIG